MSDTSKRVLERSQTGEYQFTPYGEFLSYYHAHLQVFNKFIQEKPVTQRDRDQIYQRVKGYMVSNVKKTDHFFEKIGDFASLLQMDVEILKRHLNDNFVDILMKVQDKLREQEMEKLTSKKDFAHITEELVFKLGEIFPPNCRFAFHDGLLVIENISTGEVVKPIGLLGAIKEEQQKAQEKLAARVTNKPKEPEYVPEKSILLEICEKHEDTLTGELLELKEEFPMNTPEPEPEPEPVKEKGLLDDVEELSFEMDESPAYNPEDTLPREPGLLDDIEGIDFQQETQRTITIPEEEPQGNDDILDFLDSVGPSQSSARRQAVQVSTPEEEEEGVQQHEEEEDSTQNEYMDSNQSYSDEPEENSILDFEPEPEIEPEPELPDPADLFTFKDYSELTKKIQSYKSTNDTNGYNQWLASASDLEKCFVSIRANFTKEQTGQPVDWNKYFDTVASKTQLKRSTIEKFKARVKHLDLTKAVLDIAIKELKNQSQEVISIMKSAWPHILTTFGEAPDYDSVESKLKTLLSRLKSDSQRLPIQNIMLKGIQKLRQKL
ncbi:MAG TPA: hypothetical protein PK079_14710 [Leptospiraceae bacterium]|nr:hypothetical protein [Leptospiraceae bacterium]HMW05671.1 hypothetical protein [Leptospiraceae bacterium]HMX34840.1 hypothetical protein [Leptospiraceae bacterium]HMY30296.1 hypothetical protein [Leptospiraceae bacterium]HMZ63649.1 hypothetical protein [Leptospiraceae bacterium]